VSLLQPDESCPHLTSDQISTPEPSYVCMYVCIYIYIYICIWSRDSVVSMATRYGLDVHGLNPSGGRDFPYLSRPVSGPPSLLDTGCLVVPGGGVKQPGRGVDHPLPPSTEVKERVELYLYSPSAPSWLVLG
jgi:hypothetical protein